MTIGARVPDFLVIQQNMSVNFMLTFELFGTFRHRTRQLILLSFIRIIIRNDFPFTMIESNMQIQGVFGHTCKSGTKGTSELIVTSHCLRHCLVRMLDGDVIFDDGPLFSCISLAMWARNDKLLISRC